MIDLMRLLLLLDYLVPPLPQHYLKARGENIERRPREQSIKTYALASPDPERKTALSNVWKSDGNLSINKLISLRQKKFFYYFSHRQTSLSPCLFCCAMKTVSGKK
jgi:hypothetical protein